MLSNLLLTALLSISINGISNSNNNQQNISSATYTIERLNLIDYFSYLNNIGDNPAATCVDVALCMAISYYDTYFNDSIIPDEYDVPTECTNEDFLYYDAISSPGIDSNISSSYYSSRYNAQNLLEYYMSPSQISTYLNAYKDYMVETIFPLTRGSTNTEFNLSMTQQIPSVSNSVLESISNSVSGFDFVYTSDNIVTSFSAAVDAIDHGYPILMNILCNNSLHAVLAFDYNQTDNTVYYHIGLKDSNLPYGYNKIGESQFCGGYVIKPSATSQHICSDNYYSDENNVRAYYCPCMLNGMSYPNHSHSIGHYYYYDFNLNDELEFATSHREICSPSLQANQTDPGFCINKTYDCGINHFGSGTYYYQHKVYFNCGAILEEGHHIVDFECVGTDIHEGMCLCGAFGYEHHDECLPVLVDNNIEYVCICGLIYLDHDNSWRTFIREYLMDYDYFDSDFFDELIDLLLDIPFVVEDD